MIRWISFFILFMGCNTSKQDNVYEEYTTKIFGISLILNKDKVSDIEKKTEKLRYNYEYNREKQDSILCDILLVENEKDFPKLSYSIPLATLLFDKDSILRKVKSGYLIPKNKVNNKDSIIRTIMKDYDVSAKRKSISIDTIFEKSRAFDSCCFKFNITISNE